jgi:hypothetical protein
MPPTNDGEGVTVALNLVQRLSEAATAAGLALCGMGGLGCLVQKRSAYERGASQVPTLNQENRSPGAVTGAGQHR